MTWTLRLYESDGTEIAWIKKTDDNSYSYQITHPNSNESKWDNLTVMLSRKERVYDSFNESTITRGTKFDLYESESRIENTLTPKEHLSRIQDDLEKLSEIDSTTLKDEE
jgi:hypothetical protein